MNDGVTKIVFTIGDIGFTVSESLAIVALIPAFIGGFIAIKNMNSTKKMERVNFVSNILDKLYSDEEYIKVMYILEYNKKWYSKGFQGSEFEKQMDKYLVYLSYICYLKEMKVLLDDEFKILEYKIKRALVSSDLQCYLWNLNQHTKKYKLGFSFDYLLNYAKDNNLLPEDFDKPDCEKFADYKYIRF